MERYVRESNHYNDIEVVNNRTHRLENRIATVEHATNDYRANTNYYRDMIISIESQLAEINRRLKAIEERTGMNFTMPTADDITTFLRG